MSNRKQMSSNFTFQAENLLDSAIMDPSMPGKCKRKRDDALPGDFKKTVAAALINDMSKYKKSDSKGEDSDNLFCKSLIKLLRNVSLRDNERARIEC